MRDMQRTATAASRRRGGDAVPESLTERAYVALEEKIVTLQIKPGLVLSEQALSAQVGFGRTPIREALQRLAREGLVVVLARKGILVSDTDPEQQLLVLEVRRELERLLARAAAERATKPQRTEFARMASGMDKAARENDDIAFMRLDRALNLLVLDAAHNEYAARAMRMLNGLSRRYWYLHYKQAADLPLCARLHAEQARAIGKGDKDAAGRATDRLLDYVETFTRVTAGQCAK